MVSEISAETIGKEKRDAAVQSGEQMEQPYKIKRFQPKIVRSANKNLVVPGSALEANMLIECNKFIRWIFTQEMCDNQK